MNENPRTESAPEDEQVQRDHTEKLLSFLHQNAGMGRDSVEKLALSSADPRLAGELKQHYETYTRAWALTRDMLRERGAAAREASPFARAMANLMTSLKVMIDDSPTHLAQMLIQGAGMGIIDATKKRHELARADKTALDVSDSYCAFLQKSIETYKTFL